MRNSVISEIVQGTRKSSHVSLEARVLFLVVSCLSTVAWILLYIFPSQNALYWPWVIPNSRSAMAVGVIYLGALVIYLPGLFAKAWSKIQNGLISLVIFSLALFVSAIMHWKQFRPYHPITLVWLAVYYALPLFVPIVYRIERERAKGSVPDGKRISPAWNTSLIFRGTLYAVLSILGLVFADSISVIWPWPIQPLDLRAFMAAVGVVGAVGLYALISERLWERHRPGIISTGVMGLALLVALVINPMPYNWSAPLGIVLPLIFLDWFITSGVMLMKYR